MSQIGPILDVLNNVRAELDLNSKVEITDDDVEKKLSLSKHKKNHDITHHYKMTKTQSFEVDSNQKDNHEDDKELVKDKTRKNSKGCFGGIFARKN